MISALPRRVNINGFIANSASGTIELIGRGNFAFGAGAIAPPGRARRLTIA